MSGKPSPAPKKRTTSVVVPKGPKKLEPLKKSEIAGDRSVEDFCKWIRNFAHQGSGHFVELGDCESFIIDIELKIKEMDGCIDETNDAEFINWVEEKMYHSFVSQDACLDFLRQVAMYILTDEYIGTKS
jgi:hypothetical protein